MPEPEQKETGMEPKQEEPVPKEKLYPDLSVEAGAKVPSYPTRGRSQSPNLRMLTMLSFLVLFCSSA